MSAATATGTMRAATIAGSRSVRVAEHPTPVPGPREVLIRIEGCGVCGSSLPVWEGRPWFSYPLSPGEPGHEAWGVVAAAGSEVETVAPGTRVAALSRRAFAELDVAAADAVVPLPPELDGYPFPGEALGCAVNVFRRARIEPGQRVAVVGAGFLGLVVAALAAGAGADVTAVSRRPFALELALSLGCTRARTLEGAPDETFDRVVEAAGQQQTLELAGRLTRERGLLAIAGYHQDGPRTVDLQLWNWRGLDVVNAHERDPAVYVEGMRTAVELVARGELDPAPLYTHLVPLDRLEDAFELARTRPDGFLKALAVMT